MFVQLTVGVKYDFGSIGLPPLFAVWPAGTSNCSAKLSYPVSIVLKLSVGT